MNLNRVASLAACVAAWITLGGGAAHAAQAGLPKQQQAVVQEGTGGPEVLKLESVPVPRPGSGQVLIRVYAAAINPADYGQLGRPPPAGNRQVAGLDVSGVIAAVGPDVSGLKVRQAVFGIADRTAGINGAYAHYSIASTSSIAPKPPRLSYEEAAGLGVVGVTALRAVDQANVQAGQHVLITGVAGGVGSSAAQIAMADAATVLGTASARHQAFLRALGIGKIIDYTQGNVAGQAGAIDAVIDTVGGSEALDAFHAIKPGGRFVSVVRAADITPELCTSAQVQCFGSPGPASRAPADVILRVGQLATHGKLTAHVDRAFPLASAAEALQYLHEGHAEGKVILAVTRESSRR
jgi:NADPH:quinone reductase-like Zn-dependent oxidoreductase